MAYGGDEQMEGQGRCGCSLTDDLIGAGRKNDSATTRQPSLLKKKKREIHSALL